MRVSPLSSSFPHPSINRRNPGPDPQQAGVWPWVSLIKIEKWKGSVEGGRSTEELWLSSTDLTCSCLVLEGVYRRLLGIERRLHLPSLQTPVRRASSAQRQ